MHVCILGGGAALAQPVIRHFLADNCVLTAVCRKTKPDLPDKNLTVVDRPSMVSIGQHAVVSLTGWAVTAKVRDVTRAEWDRAVNDNLSVVFGSLQELWKAGRILPNANVVIVGSIVGSTGGYGCAPYAAAKAGLVGLTRALANEWAAANVKVNLLELGYIEAGMGARLSPEVRGKVIQSIPLRRFGTEYDVVRAVDFLARTDYMTGSVLTLAGGLR